MSAKTNSISKTLRVRVWDENGGRNKRRMRCSGGCNRMIDIVDFECGHIVPRARGGGTDLSNLKPVCSSCNKSMGTINLNTFVEDQGLAIKKEEPSIKDEMELNGILLPRDDIDPHEVCDIIQFLRQSDAAHATLSLKGENTTVKISITRNNNGVAGRMKAAVGRLFR